MVNFGLNTASFLGIILALGGAGLFFLRSFRPELSRDQDIAFMAIGVICGFILIFQGWRLDPILQFGQLLLSGSTIFFAYENIQLRGITTRQAKGKSQIVDEERPVSRRYKAEIEERDRLEPPRNGRRIKGENSHRRVDRDERNSDLDLTQRRSVRQLPEDRFAELEPERRRRRDVDRDEAGSLSHQRTAESRRSYDDRRDGDSAEDWNDTPPKLSRRALPEVGPDIQLRRKRARRDDGGDFDRTEPREEYPPARDEAPPRRRRPHPDVPTTVVVSPEDVGVDEEMSGNYVDYELISDSESKLLGLPVSGTEPIVFPDRY